MKFSNFLKRISAFSLALVFLLLAFAACKKNDERKVTDEGIVLLDEPIVVADGSGAYFKAVKPQTSTDIIDKCLSSLAKFDSTFTLTHAIAKEEDNASGDREILVGNTCRTQTKDAMSAIGYDDFSITYVENKIVVAAHNPERLTEATAFLKEKLLRVVDGRLEYIGDYTYTSEEALMIGEGASLSDYRIVCGDFENLYGASATLQKKLKEKFGVELDIIYDTKAKEGKEIVIGNAKRDISKKLDGLNMGEGMILAENGDLLVAANDVATTLSLFDIFLEEYASGVYTDTFNFKADFQTTLNVYEKEFSDSNKRADGTDVRVMSFNLLVDIWSTSPAVKGRDITVAKTLLHYTPDVVGLQEASATWQKNLKNLLKNTPYKLTCTEQDQVHDKYGNTNFTPILYNSEKLTLIESDIEPFVNRGNTYMKTMAWAYFEVKDSGKRFVVLNTHFEAPGNTAEEKAESLTYRKAQAEEFVSLVEELEEKYGCGVVATGDFNSTEGKDRADKHKPYATLTDGVLHEAKYSADRIQRQCSTYHELGTQISVSAGNSLDHIFGTDKVKFKYFNTLVDKILMSASDHCPIYADVKLNQ